jgi:hypothetical protein
MCGRGCPPSLVSEGKGDCVTRGGGEEPVSQGVARCACAQKRLHLCHLFRGQVCRSKTEQMRSMLSVASPARESRLLAIYAHSTVDSNDCCNLPAHRKERAPVLGERHRARQQGRQIKQREKRPEWQPPPPPPHMPPPCAGAHSAARHSRLVLTTHEPKWALNYLTIF